MKSKILILITFLAVLSGCRKDLVVSDNNTTSRSAGDNDLDLLGFGYNAEDRFADERSAKAKVIDVEKIRAFPDNTNRIEIGNIGGQNTIVVSGEDAKSYAKNVTKKVNVSAGMLLFKGELKSTFVDEDFNSSKYSYATLEKLIYRKKLSIYMSVNDVKNKYLTSNFIADCETMSPAELVSTYGTHVLTDITLGGRLKLTYRSQINSTNKTRKVEAGVNLGGIKIFGLGISADGNINYSQNEITNNTNQSLMYQAIGGDPSVNITGNVNLSNPNVPTVDINQWQSTVSTQNSRLIGIGENGLIPLYELVPGYKGEEVREYLLSNKFQQKRGINYFINGDLVLYYSINLNKPFLLMKFPDGFRIIDQADHHITSDLFNKSDFNDVNIFGNETVVPFVVDSWFSVNPTHLKSLEDMYNSKIALEDLFISASLTPFMQNHDSTRYPFNKWFLDVVKLQSSNKYYIRLTTSTILNAANDFQKKIILFPIQLSDIVKYKFTTEFLVSIPNTDGAQIGPAF
ncbi:MAC/perforin domain-containing protein [Sphingobacterium spiritivorum]|uniref:MAC/perforin domain-containing protein n=1 Tax=Sphingobacterium spiritivorum TaxID=258 RepID=UPI003DA6C847